MRLKLIAESPEQRQSLYVIAMVNFLYRLCVNLVLLLLVLLNYSFEVMLLKLTEIFLLKSMPQGRNLFPTREKLRNSLNFLLLIETCQSAFTKKIDNFGDTALFTH